MAEGQLQTLDATLHCRAVFRPYLDFAISAVRDVTEINFQVTYVTDTRDIQSSLRPGKQRCRGSKLSRRLLTACGPCSEAQPRLSGVQAV